MKYFISVIAILLSLIACNRKPSTDAIDTEVTVTDSIVPDERGYIVKVGDLAPDFTAIDAATGDSVRLSDFRNKRIVMLQFTASWCGVCRREMPEIERRIWQRHKDNTSFALLGIDRDEPDTTVINFAKKTGVTYPLMLDPGADIFGLYADKRAGITRNVIIDRDGRIVMLTRLYDEEEFNQMVNVIDSLLVDIEK